MSRKTEGTSGVHKVLTVVGVILCIILIPMLVINCTLLIKGVSDKDTVPSFAGVSPMIVLTPSMQGVFDAGDLIFIKTATPEDIEIGDVISFFDPDGTGTSVLTHRVQDIITDENGDVAYITKGDANNTEDPTPAPAKNLIGEYTGVHIANAGNIALFMQTTPGLIVCVILPLIILIGYDAIRRKMYAKKHEDDKTALLRELEELKAAKKEAEAKVAESTKTEIEK